MDDPRFDPLDYVSVFNRRKWYFIVPVALSLVIGLLLVWKLPRTYQATTTIAVSSARLASNLVGSVEMDRTERMHAVSQQLLSRPVLERTVRLEHMDAGGKVEAAILKLRAGIQVSLPDSITPSGAAATPPTTQLSPDQKASLDSYLVSYTDDTPEDAQRIVNRLANVFVEENSKSREVRALDTSAFISTELQASENRLKTLEERLRQMKEAYMGRLPEQTTANLQMVSTLQRQLDSNGTALRGEQDRLALIEHQLEAMQQGADDTAYAAKGTPGETAAMHVQSLRRQLADAQLTFTEKHPEVVRLKEELATAEKAEAAERARPAADRLSVLNASPEYRSLVKDRDATKMRIAELQRPDDAGQRRHCLLLRARRSSAAGRAADGVAPARVRPRTFGVRRPDTKETGGAPCGRTAKEAGRRAVCGARSGEPPGRAVQAEAAPRDADGARGRVCPRRRRRCRT